MDVLLDNGFNVDKPMEEGQSVCPVALLNFFEIVDPKSRRQCKTIVAIWPELLHST